MLCLKGTRLILITTFLLISISSTWSSPITKRLFKKIQKVLEDKVQEEFPSDADDESADLLQQATHDKKKMTYYHAGDPKQPVFISFGTGSAGQKVHVLLRGEDYINPQDKHTFVVLRQTSDSEKYAVHTAFIVNITDPQGSNVVWQDVLVEQKNNLKKLLSQIGNAEVQGRSLRSRRPLCDWFGSWLLCNSNSKSTKIVEPFRGERLGMKPKDEEDDEPVKLPAGSGEEGETKTEKKRESILPQSIPEPVPAPPQAVPKPTQKEKIVDVHPDPEDNQIEGSKPKKGKEQGHGSQEAKIVDASEKAERKENVTKPKGRAVNRIKVESHEDKSEEQVSKKKHKKKHKKSKRKD